jgi:hypothetical protein
MHMNVEFYTKWEEGSNLITTRLSGPITEADAIAWEKDLTQVLQSLPEGTKFKIFVNFFGLNPSSVHAHKSYRNVMPLLLSKCGWRIGYLDLFEEANDLKISSEKDIKCFAAVHCHHDSYKIQEYENRFGKVNEHFFDDPIFSENWIRKFETLDPVR